MNVRLTIKQTQSETILTKQNIKVFFYDLYKIYKEYEKLNLLSINQHLVPISFISQACQPGLNQNLTV